MDHLRSLVQKLKEKQFTLALAESMTCGLASAKLAGHPDTSDFFAGSIVCYSQEVKCGLLGIPESFIEKYTCESRKTTEALVRKLSGLISADVHAAVTGLAASGGSENKQKPVGTVYFCVRYKKKLRSEKKVFRGAPAVIREKACDELYRMIRRIIE